MLAYGTPQAKLTNILHPSNFGLTPLVVGGSGNDRWIPSVENGFRD